MKFGFWFSVWLTAMLVMMADASAAEIGVANRFNEYSAPSTLGFIRHLISKKEYFRAYTELRRIESFYPGYIPREHLYVTSLYLLYNGNRFDDLLKMKIRTDRPDINCIDALFKTDALLAGSEYLEAAKTIAKCGSRSDDALLLMSFKRVFFGTIMLEDYSGAGKLIPEADFDETFDPETYRELVRVAEKNLSRTKKPALAALCGAVPGMGYTYAGNTSTGVIALIAVSILGSLTYFSYKTENKAMAVFFGIGTAFFYTGSIVGGVRESVAYNEWLRNRTKESLLDGLDLDSDRDVVYKRYGIMNDNTRR